MTSEWRHFLCCYLKANKVSRNEGTPKVTILHLTAKNYHNSSM